MEKEIIEGRYLSVQAYARLYGVHENTVYNLIKRGAVEWVRIGYQYRIKVKEKSNDSI